MSVAQNQVDYFRVTSDPRGIGSKLHGGNFLDPDFWRVSEVRLVRLARYQEWSRDTDFRRTPVTQLDKLLFTLGLGRSQLVYLLFGALSDGIAALFGVRSVVRKQFDSFLCVLQRHIFLVICEVGIRQAVIYIR